MSTKFRTKAKHDFEKDFLKLMNGSVFGITIDNVTKHKNIKLVTTNRKKSFLVADSNCHKTN